MMVLASMAVSCYGTNSPVQVHTHIIGFTLKVPDAALIRSTSEVSWEMIRGRNPYLTDQCSIRNF